MGQLPAGNSGTILINNLLHRASEEEQNYSGLLFVVYFMEETLVGQVMKYCETSQFGHIQTKRDITRGGNGSKGIKKKRELASMKKGNQSCESLIC